jgi:hypothetical protein
MTINDIEIDEENDINQSLIVDCQICCQPIELSFFGSLGNIEIIAKQENE